MKLVKIYEEVLRENKAESCIAMFGKELFDPQLSVSGEPSEVEPNTELENEYLKYIQQFTGIYHGTLLKPKFVEAMKNLKGCIKQYPEVLQPVGVAYRGTSLPLSKLLSQFDDISDDMSSNGEFTMNYKPKSIIQSWADEMEIAEEFAKIPSNLNQCIGKYNNVKNNPNDLSKFIEEIYPILDNISCPVIIKLITSNNDFLFKAKYLTFLSKFEDEGELLRVSDKPTKVTATIYKTILNDVYNILKSIKQYEMLKKREG